MSVQCYMTVCSVAAEIFQFGPQCWTHCLTDRPTSTAIHRGTALTGLKIYSNFSKATFPFKSFIHLVYSLQMLKCERCFLYTFIYMHFIYFKDGIMYPSKDEDKVDNCCTADDPANHQQSREEFVGWRCWMHNYKNKYRNHNKVLG